MDINLIGINKFFRILPAVIWTAITLFVCFLPASELPKSTFLDKIYFDKIVHIGIYFVLFLLIVFINKSSKAIKVIAIIWCILVGLFIEFVQGNYIANRSADAFDILANLFGIFLAYVVFTYYLKQKINIY